MKAKDNNNKLPEVQKKGLGAKIRKAMFIVLSTIGLTTLSTGAVNHQKVDEVAKEVETESNIDKEKREHFSESLKVIVNNEKINEKISEINERRNEKENEDRIDKLIEKRGKEFSEEVGNEKKIKELLVQTLNKIDENFDRNASKKGALAELTKGQYKKEFINTILNVNDIIYVDMEGEENQYTLECRKNPDIKSYRVSKSIENELGSIPENNIVYSSENDDSIFPIIMMNLTYTEQKHTYSDVFASYDSIIGILKKGYRNNHTEYIRDIKYSSITNTSENEYKIFNSIYNKLSYLVGEREMEEYIQRQDIYLDSFLSEKLDQKYGEGIGQEFYQAITNLSFWLTPNKGEVTQENLNNIRDEIIKKNKIIEQKLEEEELTDYYHKVLTINKNYDEMLNTIERKISDQSVQGETSFENVTKIQRDIELKKLEKLTLKCINKEIERISNKNEALDYTKLWNYYRNTCAISKNMGMPDKNRMGEETTLNKEDFKELKNVQHNLYEKCMKYGALNIQDETLFDTLIETQLYDLGSATISYEQKGSLDKKLIISDQYLTSEILIKEKKDGSRELNIDKQYKSKGMEGTKILADIDIPKETFAESVNTIVNNGNIEDRINERINKNIIEEVLEKRR